MTEKEKVTEIVNHLLPRFIRIIDVHAEKLSQTVMPMSRGMILDRLEDDFAENRDEWLSEWGFEDGSTQIGEAVFRELIRQARIRQAN